MNSVIVSLELTLSEIYGELWFELAFTLDDRLLDASALSY